jgi:hypothetical protein
MIVLSLGVVTIRSHFMIVLSLHVVTMRSHLMTVIFIASSVRLSFYARDELSISYLGARYTTNSPHPGSIMRKIVYSALADGGEIVSLPRRPHFYCQEDSWYSFLLEAKSTSGS